METIDFILPNGQVIQIPADTEITLKVIIDEGIQEEVINTIFDGDIVSGVHSFEWNGDDESGVDAGNGYFRAILETPNNSCYYNIMKW